MTIPRPQPVIIDPSLLSRDELDALIRIGEILGPVSLDVEGGVRGGDYLP